MNGLLSSLLSSFTKSPKDVGGTGTTPTSGRLGRALSPPGAATHDREPGAPESADLLWLSFPDQRR